MKNNQKDDDVTKTPNGPNNPESSEKNSSTTEESSVTIEDIGKKEGDEFIREGHGHDYSTPVAGEDGGTEDQSASEDEKNDEDTDASQLTEQGKTAGENSTI